MSNIKKLSSLIISKKATIGIIGLGYVGLPLSILFSKSGYRVIGFDINEDKINKIQNNQTYIERIPNKDIQLILKKGFCTSDFSNISNCDFIIICVPTPLKKNNTPNLDFVKNTIQFIFKFLQSGQVLVLESTSYPGTTRELIINKLKKKFEIGKDFYVGFSSERINPGFNENTIQNVPKVVSGSSKNCLDLISKLYNSVFNQVVKSKSIEIAEYSKLLENIYRSVNIGFINEMKFVSDRMGLDIFEILKVARTKPFGFRPFKPGPGIGGHCIPIDPIYLYWKAKKKGILANFIKLSSTTNIKTLSFIKKKILIHLKKRKINKNKAKILILGLAYKPNIDDVRESSSIKIIQDLLKEGINFLRWSDPHIKNFPINSKNKNIGKSLKINKNSLQKFDLIILMTDHDKFNYKIIYKYSKHIIDCRGRFAVGAKVTRG
tara:strand:- start:31897 stop:33201 length:1305 start_codon:yes stop_codon:yes gene_type:complete